MKQMRLQWNWRLDDELYPDWDAMVTRLAASGVRVMTYVNAFLQNESFIKHPRYPEALAADVLMRDNASHAPVVIESGPGLTAGVLDLSVERGLAFAADSAFDPVRT